MKALVQNLQKRKGLATELFFQYRPDVMLVQEINLEYETCKFPASTVSKMGYGTAIGTELFVSEIKHVQSPFAEIGGFIRKKTTIATINSIKFISFHGYNGQPFIKKEKLVSHVEAVLEEVGSGPALFAGDFNTWSEEHLKSVRNILERAGFSLAYSWPYEGRDYPLDHAFTRELTLKNSYTYECSSDHRGAILELDSLNDGK